MIFSMQPGADLIRAPTACVGLRVACGFPFDEFIAVHSGLWFAAIGFSLLPSSASLWISIDFVPYKFILFVIYMYNLLSFKKMLDPKGLSAIRMAARQKKNRKQI